MLYYHKILPPCVNRGLGKILRLRFAVAIKIRFTACSLFPYSVVRNFGEYPNFLFIISESRLPTVCARSLPLRQPPVITLVTIQSHANWDEYGCLQTYLAQFIWRSNHMSKNVAAKQRFCEWGLNSYCIITDFSVAALFSIAHALAILIKGQQQKNL